MSGSRSTHHKSKVPLVKAGNATTTEASNTDPKKIKIDTQAVRREQNEQYLKNANVKAFLDTISTAEGGDYDLKYGGIKGKKNDPWRITDYSTHPGPGFDGRTTAAGRYQINEANWTQNGIKMMGLDDFSPHTQDMIAVESLRQIKALDAIVEGDMSIAISKAAKTWNALPQGPGQGNRVAGQHYVPYEKVVEIYKKNGGTVSKE